MKCGAKAAVSLMLVLAPAAGTFAANVFSTTSEAEGAYGAIIDRNVFDLRPMPTKPAPDQGTATPPPNVKLVGLMMITGHPQAVLSIADPSAPSKPPVSYVLSEEQRQASVEVKSISMATETARVQIGQSIVQLKLESNAPPATPAAPAALAGGQRPFMPGARPGGRGAFPIPAPGGGAAPGGYNPAQPASYQPAAGADNGALPARPVRTDAASDQPLTPEQQIVQIEQNRELYNQNNDPRAAIMPPTMLTPGMQQPGTGEQPTGTGNGATPTQPSLPFGAHATGTFQPPMP